MSNVKNGFTLIELFLVMGIMTTLLGFVTIALSNVQQRTAISASVQTFISDVKQQQIKAMVGDTQGGADSASYGVHIDSNQYVLFGGTTYSSTEPSNFVVNLETNLEFLNPGSNIVFSRMSGEIPTAISVSLNDSTNNNTKVIQFNKYGVISGVN